MFRIGIDTGMASDSANNAAFEQTKRSLSLHLEFPRIYRHPQDVAVHTNAPIHSTKDRPSAHFGAREKHADDYSRKNQRHHNRAKISRGAAQ